MNKLLSFRDWLVILCIAFAAIASLVSDSLNTYALYLAIPFAFVVSLGEKRVFSNSYVKIVLFLFVWVCLSYTWAMYPSYASREIRKVLGVFLLCVIVSVQARRPNMLIPSYVVYIILYLGAWYYASTHLLIVSDFSEGTRLNDEKLNANTLAYYTFYITFVLFIISEVSTIRLMKRVFRLLFIGMIPLSFFVALSTASRQVLLIQIPLIALLLWERYVRKMGAFKRFLFFFTAILLSILFYSKIESVYNSSYLYERSLRSITDDSRMTLLKESIDVGIEHAPLGVGAGNFIMYSVNHHFSHNTFTELFANTGIVGFLLYLYLLLLFFKRQWKYYRVSKDRLFLVFLIFGLVYFLDQFFYVFYTDLWLLSFFVLVATHSEVYFTSNYSKTGYNSIVS